MTKKIRKNYYSRRNILNFKIKLIYKKIQTIIYLVLTKYRWNKKIIASTKNKRHYFKFQISLYVIFFTKFHNNFFFILQNQRFHQKTILYFVAILISMIFMTIKIKYCNKFIII